MAVEAKRQFALGTVDAANSLMKEAKALYEAQVGGGLLFGKGIHEQYGLVGADTLRLFDIETGTFGPAVKKPLFSGSAEVESTLQVGAEIPIKSDQVFVRTLYDKNLTFPIHGGIIPTDTKFLLKLEGLVADVKTIMRGNTVRMSTEDTSILSKFLADGNKHLDDFNKLLDDAMKAGDSDAIAGISQKIKVTQDLINETKSVLKAEELAMLGDDAVALDKLATRIDGEADRLLESADSALAQGMTPPLMLLR